MVIAHVLAPAPFGGLETVVESLSRGQAETGDRVLVVGVFTEDPRGHAFWESLRRSPVESIPVVVSHRGYGAERRAVKETLRQHGVQVLHTHGYRADVVHASTARGTGAVAVTTVHGFTGNGLKNRIYEYLQRRAFRKFDAVVAVSEPLSGALISAGVSAERVHVVRNAWTPTSDPIGREEARTHLGVDRTGRRIGWIGRLSPEKAPDVMLGAMQHLDDDCTRLSFVGAGRLRDELADRARASGLEARVDWHGEIARVARYLKAFDVIAITSWTEGTPMILFEAMAAGVPVVTTRVGGIPDVVTEREAILCDPGDEKAIAAGITSLLQDEDRARAIVRAAAARLDHFGASQWVERYREVYERCQHGSGT